MADIVINGVTYPAPRRVAFPGSDGKPVVFDLPEDADMGLNPYSERPVQNKVIYEAVQDLRQRQTSPYNFKGSCTYAELPAGADINDTWFVTDRNYRVTWTGSAWQQSSMDETAYEEELGALRDDLDGGFVPTARAVNYTWLQGSVSTTNGAPIDADNRVRTAIGSGSITYGANIVGRVTYLIPSGYKLGGRIYDENNAFVGVIYYKTTSNTFEITPGYHYTLILCRSDDTPITPEDVPADLLTIVYSTYTDKTLSLSNKAADAAVVGERISNTREGLKKGLLQLTPSAVWIQGTINNNGALDDSDTRCRSKALVGHDTAVLIDAVIADGYMVSVVEYSAQRAITDNFVQRLIQFTADGFSFTPVTGHMYRLVIKHSDESAITPESIPDDAVQLSVYTAEVDGATISTMYDFLDIIGADGDNEEITWAQGSISQTAGANIDATNRVRSRYYLTYTSLKYLYINCPDGYLVSVRKYEQSNAATYLGSMGFKCGTRIIRHEDGVMYRLILKRDDDEDIAPSQVPEAIKVIPVFLPHWSRHAHGQSVAAITTRRSNPDYVAQIVSVAQSYYDHRNDMTDGVRDMVYGYSSAIRVDTYTNQIDCSSFVGLVLRGVLYTQTQYYTHVDTPAASVVANPDFVWSLNPQFYDYYSGNLTEEPTDVTVASQLGEWMIDMGWRVPLDKKLLNMEPGDIVFWSRKNARGTAIAQPDRFMAINHVAICVRKDPTTPGDGYYEGGFPYKHTIMEVSSVTPCVRTSIAERHWDDPSVIGENCYNTLALICRPDLGSI